MKQKTRVTFEIEETVVIRQGELIWPDYCPFCGRVTAMAPAGVLAVLTNYSEQEIFHLIEAGEIHVSEEDRVSICLNSFRMKKVEAKSI